jgi:hypothetical protein
MNGILEIEMVGQRRKIAGVVIHVMAGGRLRRTSVAAAVMRDDAKALLEKEQHLRVPIVG